MGKSRGHIPQRTCIVCGAKRGKRELLRLVKQGDGHFIRDDPGEMQGRGAYVCKIVLCLEQWERRSGTLMGKRKGRAKRLNSL